MLDTNVALFIDYENVHKTLVNRKSNTIKDGFFDRVREYFKSKNRRIVKIAVYCNFDNKDLYESYHQSLLQSYGVETVHTSNQGKNFADLQLTIDVMNAMYLNDNIDEFIIMSNDKDMTPLLNNIRYNKKKATVITTGDLYNNTLCSFADEQIKYEDIIVYPAKYFLIDELQEKFMQNLQDYFDKVYNDCITNSAPFKHIGMDYFCEIQVKSLKLMLYEMFGFIEKLKNSSKILFYAYTHNNKSYEALIPSDKKAQLIKLGTISDSDIHDYDVATKINDLYDKYKKQ